MPLLSHSRDNSYYVTTPILAPPPLWFHKHTDLRAHHFAQTCNISLVITNSTRAWSWRLCGINPDTRKVSYIKCGCSVFETLNSLIRFGRVTAANKTALHKEINLGPTCKNEHIFALAQLVFVPVLRMETSTLNQQTSTPPCHYPSPQLYIPPLPSYTRHSFENNETDDTQNFKHPRLLILVFHHQFFLLNYKFVIAWFAH